MTSFLRENTIEVLEWLEFCRGLSILENLWSIVKKRLARETLTWENLEEAVFRVWDRTHPEFVINLYNSIPKRLNDVLKSEDTVIGC